METTPAPKALGGEVLPLDAQPLEPEDPAAIGGHRLAGRLTSGGMDIVYLARDRRGGLVSVKTTRTHKAEQAQVRRRLRAEATCARRLPPFCTVPLLVDGSDHSPPYLISEYVEGPSLEQFVDEMGPLKPKQSKALAGALARALAAIHDTGLAHCDLKPANVLLAADGPRIMDFGIVQEVPDSDGLAHIGAVTDGSGWTAPERLTGGLAGLPSDVFGWGCLIRYAATGRSPSGEADADELDRPMITQRPEANALDEPVRSLVAAALAKDPADRPTAGDLVSRLGAVGRAAVHDPSARTTDVLPRLDTAAVSAATAPVPEPGTELTDEKAGRPRWVKVLAVASVPVVLAVAVAAVIATTGSDRYTGRQRPLVPGRAAIPPGQGVTGSDGPSVRGRRPAGPGQPHPASAAARNGPGSPTPGRPGGHGGHARPGRPGAPSGPGVPPPRGSSPPVSSPASPSPPPGTPTPSPLPTPTNTGAGQGSGEVTG
ncbi:MAG: hypothetical protein JWR24_901 [Actinoallomurus sp.]|nr:hypothetical protein [Actinoallomurus sp.]